MALNAKEKARLRWQCRRGMLELDLFLEQFYLDKFPNLSIQQQQVFVDLLECPDQVLFNWFIESEQSDNPEFNAMVQLIKQHRQQYI